MNHTMSQTINYIESHQFIQSGSNQPCCKVFTLLIEKSLPVRPDVELILSLRPLS
jgi:hypothetical protein